MGYSVVNETNDPLRPTGSRTPRQGLASDSIRVEPAYTWGVENRTRRGFTLIELLTVIAVIAVLSAIGLVQFSGYARARARDARRLADMRLFVQALEVFKIDNGVYMCGDSCTSSALYSVDGSGSSGYNSSDPKRSTGFLNGGDCCTTSGGYPTEHTTYPDDALKWGAYFHGLLPTYWPRDPINTGHSTNPTNHVYIYWTLAAGRSEYYLTMRLEANNTLMQNDGGICSKLYEKMSPGWLAWRAANDPGFAPAGCN